MGEGVNVRGVVLGALLVVTGSLLTHCTQNAAPCPIPSAGPTILWRATPQTPALAVSQGITGKVDVIVQIDATSNVVGRPVAISGPSILRYAAIEATLASTYRTQITNCVSVPAQYTNTVAFPVPPILP